MIALLAVFFVVLLFCVVAADDAYGRNGRWIVRTDSSQALRTAPTASNSVRSVICDVFGPYCRPALRVAYCETGGTLDPLARGRAGERGLFQIHPVHFGWLDERRLYEPRYNSRIAFRLSRGGRNWAPWACRP